MEKTIIELKQLIIENILLDNIDPTEIDSNAPLIGGGLEFDSVDMLELVILVDKKYSIRYDRTEKYIRAFHSISTLAEYINDKKKLIKK